MSENNSINSPLRFTANTDSKVKFAISGTLTTTPTISYSVNGGTWTAYTFDTEISLAQGDYVEFKGNNNSWSKNSSYITFVITTGSVAASGNIMSVLDETCESLTIPTSYCYFNMFLDCASLTTAPILPATALTNDCYSNMFCGCTSLIEAPALPATTLADGCYGSMFRGCTSLVTAPALPATTLVSNCYTYMFYECTSLTSVPVLPATTLADGCYSGMFYGCTSLITTYELPAMTLSKSCYSGMFDTCTSLDTAPALPATSLANACYFGMFRNCTSLTAAPALPATTLVTKCYSYMFYNCTSLIVSDSSGTSQEETLTIPQSGTFKSTCKQACMFTNCAGVRTSDDMAGGISQTYTYYTQKTPVEPRKILTLYKSGILCSKLPNGYTELEYIESSGTQWIDTGIIPNINTNYEISITPTHFGDINNFYGCRTASALNGYLFDAFFNYYTYTQSYTLGNQLVESNTVPALSIGTNYVFKKDGLSIYNNNEFMGAFSDVTMATLTKSFYIGMSNSHVQSTTAYGKFYYCKLYESNTLVRNFIPAKRNSDSAIGMYDTVTNTFFTNAGIGTFTAGPEIMPKQLNCYKSVILYPILPSEYTELEYIESSGTQYLNTEHIFSSGYRLQTNITFISSIYQGTQYFSGCYNGVRNYAVAYSGYFMIGMKYDSISSARIIFDTEYELDMSTISGNGYIKINGETVNTCTNIYTAPSMDTYLLNVNGYMSYPTYAKIKYAKFYESDGSLVRNFIPAKRNSDSVLGMYDAVTNTFFTNAGTGTFTAGPEQANPTLQQVTCYRSKILYA